MTKELKDAILDARYVEMISLADFVVRECDLPDMDDDGNLLPQANEVAAAIFRWAAGLEATAADEAMLSGPHSDITAVDAFQEYDEHGDPILPVEVAERLEALMKAQTPTEGMN